MVAACRHGHHGLIEPLVSAGADVNSSTTACHACSTDYYTETSGRWNSSAAYYYTHSWKDKTAGDSPLIIAVRYGHLACVEACIRLGADVNQSGQQSRTPLMEAVTQSLGAPNIRENIIKLLIKSGAAVNKKDCTGETALIKALHNGHLELAKVLMESRAKVNIGKEALGRILLKAATNGNTELIKFIVQSRVHANTMDFHGGKALLAAASEGNMDIVRLLVQAGANVNSTDHSSETPLIKALCRGHLCIAEFLMASGADINKSQLALCIQVLIGVAARGNVDMIKFIVKSGFKFEAVPVYASEALCRAASGGHMEIARILVQAGANVNGKDCCGERPLIKSLFRGDVRLAKFLIESGADINIVHKKSLETALRNATLRGNVGIVRLIVQSKHSTMIQQCLHKAVAEGNLEIVKLLADAGTDFNSVSSDSKTAVMLASSKGYVEVVKILVGKGADVNFVPGHNQLSPLLCASCNGHINTVIFLIKRDMADGGA